MASKLLYLDKPGIGLSVRAGSLIVRQASDEASHSPQGHSLSCVIIAGPGFISFDALAWCAREHVGLLVFHGDGSWQAIADAPSGRLARRELALRRRQMECTLEPKRRLAAARAIVDAKLLSLGLEAPARRAFVASLTKTRCIQDVLVCEAEHAALYWHRWRGFQVKFKGDCPEGWRTFEARARSWRTGRLGEKERQFSNRFALHPVNAMLNYSGAIIATQCARACAGLGLDPAFGVLHADVPGRASLAWDVYELLRIKVEASVFEFTGSRVFTSGEFKIVNEPKPHLRFAGPLARELAAYVMRRVPFAEVVKVVRRVATMF